MTSDQFSNKSIAEILRNIAAAYLLQQGPDSDRNNRFKIIAYQKAADTVEHLSRELKDIWQEGKLQKVPGIGPGIGSGLSELFENGTSSHFNEVLKGIPPSVFLLMKVPGIGPKKAFRLVAHFGLTEKKTVIDDLRNLAKAGEIEDLEGFGRKSQDDIIEGLEVFKRQDRREERMPMPYAIEIATEVIKYMNELGSLVKRIDSLGSLRRRVATIGDIDLAVVAEERDMQNIIDHFLKYPGKRTVEAAGERKASILAAGNIRIDLRVQDAASYGSMLQYFTGSKAHNIKLREYALKKGYSLNEYGLKEITNDKLRITNAERENSQNNAIQFQDEESLYSFLGLQYVPPELREDVGEIEIAAQKKLPKLIDLPDIKGDFHMHSSYNIQTSHDVGLNTYEELVEKAVSLHYSYIGFADHNPRQKGLSSEETVSILKARKEHIDQVISTNKIPYFIGLEVDILPSGEIAFPKEGLEYVDYLIVSVHSSFKMKRREMTQRVLKALSYPKVKIFGHPTARLLGTREGVEMDWDQIFEHVIKHNQALEINSGPSRLDLPDSLVKEGVEKGVKFFINTDAHAVKHMDWMKYGVFVARRGWLEKKDVVNTWEPAALKKWILQ